MKMHKGKSGKMDYASKSSGKKAAKPGVAEYKKYARKANSGKGGKAMSKAVKSK